jgi:hypothetical protein
MKKKILGLFIILLVASSGSTCRKKIKKYPFNLYGMWFCGTGSSCEKFLEIERNGNGKMFTASSSYCLNNKDAKGTVKYKKDILYIGSQKFTIFDEPIINETNDSIVVPDEAGVSNSTGAAKKYKVIATMKLQPIGLLKFKENYFFSKYIEY